MQLEAATYRDSGLKPYNFIASTTANSSAWFSVYRTTKALYSMLYVGPELIIRGIRHVDTLSVRVKSRHAGVYARAIMD